MVLKSGRIVESGEAEQVFQNPQADYTKTLMAASGL
jgi:ABC-type microcin C transport system duplicated ATPase subunit YejF